MLGVWFSVVRERERGERKTENWAPSLSGSRSKPVGLGKRTKQRVKASSQGERKRLRSLQPTVWGDRLYLEIPGFSTNDLGESREQWFEARASFSAQELDPV